MVNIRTGQLICLVSDFRWSNPGRDLHQARRCLFGIRPDHRGCLHWQWSHGHCCTGCSRRHGSCCCRYLLDVIRQLAARQDIGGGRHTHLALNMEPLRFRGLQKTSRGSKEDVMGVWIALGLHNIPFSYISSQWTLFLKLCSVT